MAYYIFTMQLELIMTGNSMCSFFIFQCLTANQAALLHTCITSPNNHICGAYYVHIISNFVL